MFELTPFVRTNDPFRMMFDPSSMMDKEWYHIPPMKAGSFRTDIHEDGNAFILEADLPGMKKEDIHISLDGGFLTISAEHKEETAEKEANGYVRRERYSSYASRSFDMTGIDTQGITANYSDGVLKLNLPKETKTDPAVRQILID